jgi:hypothetical protein
VVAVSQSSAQRAKARPDEEATDPTAEIGRDFTLAV